MRDSYKLIAMIFAVAMADEQCRAQDYLPRYEVGCSPDARAEIGLLTPPCILDRDYAGRPFYRPAPPVNFGLPTLAPLPSPVVPYNERTLDLGIEVASPFYGR